MHFSVAHIITDTIHAVSQDCELLIYISKIAAVIYLCEIFFKFAALSDDGVCYYANLLEIVIKKIA